MKVSRLLSDWHVPGGSRALGCVPRRDDEGWEDLGHSSAQVDGADSIERRRLWVDCTTAAPERASANSNTSPAAKSSCNPNPNHPPPPDRPNNPAPPRAAARTLTHDFESAAKRSLRELSAAARSAVARHVPDRRSSPPLSRPSAVLVARSEPAAGSDAGRSPSHAFVLCSTAAAPGRTPPARPWRCGTRTGPGRCRAMAFQPGRVRIRPDD
jgi:hypothetical protein